MGKNRPKGSSTQSARPGALVEPVLSFESDFQTYCAFKQVCKGWLGDAVLDEIWHSAKDLVGPHSYREKYHLALAFVQDRMTSTAATPSDKPIQVPPLPAAAAAAQTKKEKRSPQPTPTPLLTSSTPFDHFAASYSDIIEMEKLLEIWQGLDGDLPEDEKAEIASLYALDYLQSQCARVAARHKPLRPRKQLRHQSKMLESMTDQELALYVLGDIFEGEGLTERDCRLALMDHAWNLDAATKSLCDKLLKNGCFIRPGLSFVEVAAAPPPVPSAWAVHTASAAVAPLPSPHALHSFPQQATVVHSSGRISSLPPPHMVSEESPRDSPHPAQRQSPEYHLAMRSLCIFRQKNPCIHLSLTSHLELRFDGTDASFHKQQERDVYVLGLSVDLHGLLVVHSLQIVDSCLEYYYTHGDRLCASTMRKQLLLSFIVGKGLHSMGGQARLGPAVCKYLRERGEERVLLYDGVVSVHITLQ